jgi:hypothetical protein
MESIIGPGSKGLTESRPAVSSQNQELWKRKTGPENGLVGHHWEERPLGLANFICPNTQETPGPRSGSG